MSSGGGIWIQGAGELGSAVAVCLVRAGYRVVLAETALPMAVRRLVCFAEAVYAGQVEVAGIAGHLRDGHQAGFGEGVVDIIVDPAGVQLVRLRPLAYVDARLAKRPPTSPDPGPIPRIGLGPGFTCGVDADLIVETHREAGPGRVIEHGAAAPDTGVPGVVGGQALARLLRAPAAGRLRPRCAIGDLVTQGQVVGEVGGLPVVAGLDGLLRGLVHERAELHAGVKVGDVDPRGASIDPRAVSDKGWAVGDGVVEALARLGVSAGRWGGVAD
ncbi:MAG: EF2563 family selenium-dependent molybdenum hydroxylase system protein [bacterium]|nr:EF2563 family selenium-dependent molybdenum hydroxylase system protein [bacterium]